MKNIIISEDKFKTKIKDAKFFVVGGFRRSGTPQQLLRLMRNSFHENGTPSKITLMFSSTPTDPGVDILADENQLDRVIGSFYGSIPHIRKLVQDNRVKGYSFPQGQVSLLLREIGRGSPGLISGVGLHSFVDPDVDGGRMNTLTTESLIEKIKLEGQEFLFFKTHKVDVALLRGTTVDSLGNISMKDEPIKTEFLAMAQAAKSSGGKVYVQVLTKMNKSLPPAEVDLPHHLVDGIILCKNPEMDHRQTNKYQINQNLISGKSEEKTEIENNDALFKHLIARRTLRELDDATQVNLGQGLPELVGTFAKQAPEKYGHILTHLESGVIGGTPERRPDFGAAMGPTAFLTQDNQFVCFNGGQLDATVLSFAQVDAHGNINVSRIGSEDFGGGGFIDIVHATKKIIFVGSFTAKGLEIVQKGNSVSVIKEGSIQKFVHKVSQITYASKLQAEKMQTIKIITERCVFSVVESSLILTEIAEGVDLEKDILQNMAFQPTISDSLKLMDFSIDGFSHG